MAWLSWIPQKQTMKNTKMKKLMWNSYLQYIWYITYGIQAGHNVSTELLFAYVKTSIAQNN